MNKMHRVLAGCAAALLVAASARAAEWTEDYSSALSQARKEHKLLLLDFTGSDWCSWCKRTDAEVLSTPKFQDFASQRLVLVKVDFPRTRELKDDVKAQNARLAAKYGIRGYPTLIVLDPDEKVVFKQEGYEDGGPDPFLAKFPKPAN
jgi:protein disulfide-isomerase